VCQRFAKYAEKTSAIRIDTQNIARWAIKQSVRMTFVMKEIIIPFSLYE
jgi:hypothetical protein